MANYEDTTGVIEERLVGPVVVGGIRMHGKYSDCGKGFGRLGRKLRRSIVGTPMLLHYDTEYKADDADFEACVPIREGREVEGVEVHELPGGRCVTLVHKGPYEELGKAYEKVSAYVREHGYRVVVPTREVYLKGPGMIFRGDPKKYVTEIQMLVESEA